MITKVKSIQANGTFKSPHGVDLGNGQKGFFKFEYHFEDDEVLNVNHKTPEPPFKTGDEVEYEITNAQYNNGKVFKPKEQFQKKDDYVRGIEVGHAINNAVNMICAGVEFDNIPTDLKTGQKIEAYARNVMAIAEKLKNE